MGKNQPFAQHDSCPVPVVVFEKTGNEIQLIYWNPAMIDMTNGHVIRSRKNAPDIFSRSPEIVSDLNRCFKTKRTFQTERSYYFQHIDRLAHYIANYHYLPGNKVEVYLIDITRQKHFEKQVFLGKENMKLLVEYSDFILVTYNDQARINYYYGSPRYGMDASKAVGKKLTEILDTKETQDNEKIVRKVLESGRKIDREYRYIIRGKELCMEESFYPIPGPGKKRIELVGYIGRDVTETKNMKMRLEQNEMRYTQVFEKSKDGICFCETIPAAKGKTVAIVSESNPAFADLMGLKGKELTGKKVRDIFPEIGRMRFGDEDFNGPYEIFRPSNGRHTKVQMFRVRENHFVLMAEDITEKKNAEIVLMQSEKKYREITDLIRVIIVETDLELNIVFTNLYAARKLFGRSSRPEVPVNLADLIEPKDREKIRMNFQDIISGKEAEMKAFHIRNTEGVRMFVLSNAVQILGGNSVLGVRIAIFELNEIAGTIVFPDNELNKKYGLSKRESDVLFSLISGLTDQDIAEKLFISKPTVRFHITNLYNKLGVNRKKELLDFMKNNFVSKLGYENLLVYILNSFLKE